MPAIAKLGHVAIITPDIEKSLWFFRDVLGLETVAQDAERVYLRGWGEFEHHSLSLAEGAEAGIDHVGWRASAPEDVAAYADRFSATGVEFDRIDPGTETGQGEAIRFLLPEGGDHPFEIYYDIEKPLLPEERRSRLKNQTAKSWARGASVRCIDHVNLWTANPEPPAEWMANELGFKHREMVRLTAGPMVGTWMSVTSLVHDVALFGNPSGDTGRFHHVAYYLDNWQDVLRAMDILAEENIPVDLGPGRHGISQAFFCYVKDPGSGHRVELFSGGYHIFDPDWEPVVWNETELAEGLIWWGPEYMPGQLPAMDGTTACRPAPAEAVA
ncbi:MAG TPA: VOC family protein [Solirubrobacteraceae bacterium]|jgi:catechol 2,3-dioxygenase|nr:VOC family protein [Solirubrobacteraceae bacterium]